MAVHASGVEDGDGVIEGFARMNHDGKPAVGGQLEFTSKATLTDALAERRTL